MFDSYPFGPKRDAIIKLNSYRNMFLNATQYLLNHAISYQHVSDTFLLPGSIYVPI